MSTNPKMCNICDERHVSKPATDWCSECDEFFCSECKEYHGFSRSSQNHATIPISNYLALESSFLSISSICTEHNEIYHLVCQTHDQLLCLRCIEKHNECKGIFPLSEIAKNVKSSTNFQETQHGLTDINENITKILGELKLSFETINDEENILISEIGSMRKKINDHFNKLEDDLRKDLSKKATESRTSIEVLLQKLDVQNSEITKHLQKMKDLETYASDFQTYLSLRQISSTVESTESFVQSVAKDGHLEIDALNLNFDEKINEIVSNIQQFGMVQVQKKACHVALIRQKDKQAQIVGSVPPVINSIDDIKLKLVQTIDTKCEAVRGCVILSDGKMLFSDYTTTGNVVVVESDGKYLFDILKTEGRPCMDITCIDDNTNIAITDGYVDKCIKLVDIRKPEVIQKRITTKNTCFGVVYNGDSLLCCILKEGIQKISLENNKVSTIVKCDLGIGYITVHKNKLYYTDDTHHVVACTDMEGRSISLQTSKSLKWPISVLDCTDFYSTSLNWSEFYSTILDPSLNHTRPY